ASPMIATTASAGGVVGTAVPNDTAVLSNGFSPTGTITFTLIAPDSSTAYTETVPVNGNGSYSTRKTTPPTHVGTYTCRPPTAAMPPTIRPRTTAAMNC